MPLVCPICRDGLEGSGLGDSESGLVAGECGHVFHKECLSKWIEQGSTSTTTSKCPCCRGNVSISKFIALYPTICHDVSITDSSEDFETLKSTIDDLKNSIQSLNDNLQESELEAVVLRKQIEDLKTENSKLSTANKVWVQLSDKKVHYKNICVNLKAKVQSLELKLSQYESVKKITNMKQPCSKVISNANDCCNELAKNLIEENKLLSREIQNLNLMYGKLKENHDRLNILYADTNIQLHEFLN